MELLDLHTHSSFSDGLLGPAELVDLARAHNIRVLALTDHDTVDGIPEALAQGRRQGVEVVPGIEISAWHENLSMHILGYWLQHDSPEFLASLEKLQNGRHERNIRIIARLKHMGLQVTEEELQVFSVHGQTGRPHIARLLTEKGLVRDVDQAFTRYLKRGAAAYIERFRFHIAEAIRMISNAQGMAVLAHPVQLDPGLRQLPSLLRELQGYGLKGIEAYYPGYARKTIKTLVRLAEECGLLVTGGSDFHGDQRHNGSLGMVDKNFPVPFHLYDELLKGRFEPVSEEVA